MLDRIRLSQLTRPLDGELVNGDTAFSRICTDTRTLKAGDLFVALSGPNFDGNRFVRQALDNGAVGAIVSVEQPEVLPQLVVTDTLKALGQLAALRRQAYRGVLVAVTGSSGKTSVKELLASILSTQGPVLATRGNLNNEIGVPLTLMGLAPEHRYAVVELGASGPGEIAYTVGLSQPEVAIVNNAGGAHLEGFGSLAGVVRSKGEIFDGIKLGGTGVVNLDDPHAGVWRAQLKGKNCLTFSLVSADADLFASHLQLRDDGCFDFVLNSHQDQVPVRLNVLGRHAVSNALAAACAAQALGLALGSIRQGLEAFAGVAGRLAPRKTPTGVRVIDDSYNANPDSVKVAVDVLAGLPGDRVLVLGNMAELGDDAAALHGDVGRYTAEQGIQCLLATGDLAARAVEAYRQASAGTAELFADKAALTRWLKSHMTDRTVILVKGSRSSRMEEIIETLLAKDRN